MGCSESSQLEKLDIKESTSFADFCEMLQQSIESIENVLKEKFDFQSVITDYLHVIENSNNSFELNISPSLLGTKYEELNQLKELWEIVSSDGLRQAATLTDLDNLKNAQIKSKLLRNWLEKNEVLYFFDVVMYCYFAIKKAESIVTDANWNRMNRIVKAINEKYNKYVVEETTLDNLKKLRKILNKAIDEMIVCGLK